MATQLSIDKDPGSVPTWAIPFQGDASCNFRGNLAADTDVSVSVPANVNIALFAFQPGTTVWVSPDALATLPVFPVNDRAESNPAARKVSGEVPVTTLHFRSTTQAEIWVGFYK